MDGQLFLNDSLRELRRLKQLAEAACDQVTDAALFMRLDAEGNSLAILMKHMAGNMKSRWRDFLTTDGEKPDRNRDGEFALDREDDRSSLLQTWEDGWNQVFVTLEGLSANDLEKTVVIRGEDHVVLQAIQRQLSHYAYHVGQMVFLARHLVGADWRSLSIPRGRSDEFVKKPGNYLKN